MHSHMSSAVLCFDSQCQLGLHAVKLNIIATDIFFSFSRTYLFIFFFYVKRVLAKGKINQVWKKIPFVARSCKEDSRRNIDMAGEVQFSMRGVLILLFWKSLGHRQVEK